RKGIRKALKMPRLRPCGFESRRPHQTVLLSWPGKVVQHFILKASSLFFRRLRNSKERIGMSNGSSTTVLQNDKVKVTLWHFQPGQDTGWHRHQYDYVIVPLTAGRLRLEVPGGGEEFSD